MDAIQLIKKDHAAVERLFVRFERASRAERSSEMKRLVRSLVKELSVHAAIEEQALYPALRRAGEDVEDAVLEALEEHHLVKLTLLELDAMSPKAERYPAKVSVLIENVRHHVQEEERALLPRLRRAMDAKARRDLGELMNALKRAAPTRPHPGAPDTPPGNLVMGTMAAIYDRSRDAVRGLAERGRRREREAVRRGKGSARRTAEGARRRVRAATSRTRAAARAFTEEQPTVH